MSAPPQQQRWCEECGRPEICWEISNKKDIDEKEYNKDINRRKGSLTALFGRKKETVTETRNVESSKPSNVKKRPFYLCPDPTCKEHIDTRCEVTRWKLRNASSREYSDNEVKEIVEESVKQAIRDYHTVTEYVNHLYDIYDINASENKDSIEESVKTASRAANTDEQPRINNADTVMAEDPSLQIPRCETCERQEIFQEISASDTSVEQESEKNTNHTTHQMSFSLSFVPFVGVGGETESGDETIEKERSTYKTTDTATFSICPEMTCKSHLMTLGQMHCWELRNDSSDEYSNKEVNEIVEETLEQEIRDHAIVTETAENVSGTFLNDSSESESEQASSNDNKTNEQSQKQTTDSPTKKQVENETENEEETKQTEQYDNNGQRYLDSYSPTGDQSKNNNNNNNKGTGNSL